MKKYLLSLIPFIICSLLSLIYLYIQPQDYPHPSYPYRTPGVLYYLSSRWFIIGIVLSVLCFLIMVVEDIFGRIEKWSERRHLKK
jgi:hypothetical protein